MIDKAESKMKNCFRWFVSGGVLIAGSALMFIKFLSHTEADLVRYYCYTSIDGTVRTSGPEWQMAAKDGNDLCYPMEVCFCTNGITVIETKSVNCYDSGSSGNYAVKTKSGDLIFEDYSYCYSDLESQHPPIYITIADSNGVKRRIRMVVTKR